MNMKKVIAIALSAIALTSCSNVREHPTESFNTENKEVTTEMNTAEITEASEYGKSGLLKNATIVFTGDSITDGYRLDRSDPTDLGQNNYVTMFNDYIQTNFPEDHITVYNTGHSGYWIQHLRNELQSFVYDLDPDYLIVNIGTNNAWFDKSPIENVEKEYRELVEELLEKTDAHIILVQPYLYESDTILDGVPLNEYIPRMNQISDIVCRTARDLDLRVIFYSEIFRQAITNLEYDYKPLLSADGIHPSTIGYRMFFDTLCTELGITGYTPRYHFDFSGIEEKYNLSEP